MKRWQQLPNPIRVLDYDGDTITWTHIVDRLGEFEIDFRQLDGPLYENLRACEDEDTLTARLFEIKFLQSSGTLLQRSLKWKDEGEMITDRQLKDETDRMYPMSLNNKRFSHRFPMGIDMNDLEAEAFEMTAEGTARRSAEDEKREQLSRPRGWWEACKSMTWSPIKQCYGYPAWRYIIFPSLVFLPMMGGFVYMWLQEDGCGDRCLDQGIH